MSRLLTKTQKSISSLNGALLRYEFFAALSNLFLFFNRKLLICFSAQYTAKDSFSFVNEITAHCTWSASMSLTFSQKLFWTNALNSVFIVYWKTLIPSTIRNAGSIVIISGNFYALLLTTINLLSMVNSLIILIVSLWVLPVAPHLPIYLCLLSKPIFRMTVEILIQNVSFLSLSTAFQKFNLLPL